MVNAALALCLSLANWLRVSRIALLIFGSLSTFRKCSFSGPEIYTLSQPKQNNIIVSIVPQYHNSRRARLSRSLFYNKLLEFFERESPQKISKYEFKR